MSNQVPIPWGGFGTETEIEGGYRTPLASGRLGGHNLTYYWTIACLPLDAHAFALYSGLTH